MSIISFGRIAPFPLLILMLAFYSYRMYQRGVYTSLIIRMTIATALIMVAVISAVPRPVPFWLHSLGTAAMHYSVFMTYICIDQLLNNKPYQPAYRTKLFLLVTLISAVVAFADYQ